MIAVAAVAISLGGVREAIRLSRVRNELFAKAAVHLEAETYFRGLESSTEKSILHRKPAFLDSTPSPASSFPLEMIGDRPLEFLGRDGPGRDKDVAARFGEAQARADAMADRGRALLEKRLKRQAEYWKKQAEYHADLRQKYTAGAARPWRSIEPDPPRPN
jgi:hypothetical protein